MTRKSLIVAALLGSFALVSAASAATRVVYLGGHNPANQLRIVTVSESAPYALTGNTFSAQRYETIRQDSRFVGVRPVGN